MLMNSLRPGWRTRSTSAHTLPMLENHSSTECTSPRSPGSGWGEYILVLKYGGEVSARLTLLSSIPRMSTELEHTTSWLVPRTSTEVRPVGSRAGAGPTTAPVSRARSNRCWPLPEMVTGTLSSRTIR